MKRKMIFRNISPPKESELAILTTGMPDYTYNEAYTYLSKKYGFRYWPASGCVVSEKILDSVYLRNNISYDILEKQYGTDWETNFYSEAKVLQNRISKAKKIFYHSRIFDWVNYISNNWNEYSGFDFSMNELNSNLINIEAYRYMGRYNFTWSETIYCFTIDIRNGHLNLTDSIGKIEIIKVNRLYIY